MTRDGGVRDPTAPYAVGVISPRIRAVSGNPIPLADASSVEVLAEYFNIHFTGFGSTDGQRHGLDIAAFAPNVGGAPGCPRSEG